MNTAMPLPKPRTQKLGADVITRLRSVLAAVADRGTAVKAESRPYSFQSACECPDHCPRDHENE